MPDPLQTKILEHLKSTGYRPQRPRRLAQELNLHHEESYHAFRDALRELMHQGHVVLGGGGNVLLPAAPAGEARDEFVGVYRHNQRGFGFVVPTDPASKEDLYIPEGENGGAMTGDIVRAKITNRRDQGGQKLWRGRIVQIITRSHKKFAGSLARQHGKWVVLPDGNTLTSAINTPDAGSWHVKPGTKVVVELTHYPTVDEPAQGVITEVLGAPGQKDVDFRAIVVQFNLPEKHPEEALAEARAAVDRFNSAPTLEDRLDLSDEIICTIDPDDAKDYDDAISLRQLDSGYWELGVHIADVSHFVPTGGPLDEEAKKRGNSCYFPGQVIPMLPEILSNGVCSLQEGVPRLCKSAFITFGDDAKPLSARFANTIIHSACRLRYREAQAIIDHADLIPHPDGPRKVESYPPEVIELLGQMNALARRIQKRRLAAGQIVLDLPEVELILDEDGKIIGAEPEDTSFTHTLIEMFMVEANEAVARLLDGLNVPFLRRIHPEPKTDEDQRLRQFVQAGGYRLPKVLDRKAIQALLATVKGKPEAFAINLSVLRSLSRAEYSPQVIGHYALASEHYCHFTSPIRRYADLTIHRLLDEYFKAQALGRKGKSRLENVIPQNELVDLGKHLSFTERNADDAERELRQVKILELLTGQVGEDFAGVVTGITNFGIFVQLSAYLIDGLIRYEDLMDDWWDVDVASGMIRGQRTGRKIGIGDVVTARIVRVDPPRRQLDLSIVEVKSRAGQAVVVGQKKKHRKGEGVRGGENRRQRRRR
ncbi:MAG TPA: ribonuclease R [Tepidisphaeraceae bacterium]|nr:ribonuclease R [Tepidisphaeraceae bacterium]